MAKTTFKGSNFSKPAPKWWRKLIDLPVPVVNVPFINTLNNGDGVLLYDNACILPFAQTSATTATNIQGTVTTVER